jgi:cytochrome c-type biogenesis protein CcmH/NrfG
MGSQPRSRVLDAIDALRVFDRERAVRLLEEELRQGPPSGDRWKSVGRLAAQIGETDIAIEAARRFAQTSPATLERLLHYWGELAGYDRSEEAREEVGKLPAEWRGHEAVLHLLGTIAGQEGDFAEAERFYRGALARSPHLPQTWFALAMIKSFAPGDPDLAAMERLLPEIERGAPPSLQARFLYGLAKARHDCADYDRAFALYSRGAALRRLEEKWDPAALSRYADALIRDFTPDSLQRLAPSGSTRKALFVNGLPRSGTTLVEQILVSHSQVAEGGEVNLLRAALIPTGDYSFAGAARYEQRATAQGTGPWGALAESYFRLLRMRFRTDGLVVDKTLSQSHYMGLLLHMLPEARVIWMRRDPEDVALSCFRNFFTGSIPWCWSLEDIGRFFAIEDRLFAHWSRQFPGRILVVPYEELVRAPDEWIPRILHHAGLPDEPQVREFHATRRNVRTASVQQVRAPISTTRIGQAEAYAAHLEPFRAAYAGR